MANTSGPRGRSRKPRPRAGDARRTVHDQRPPMGGATADRGETRASGRARTRVPAYRDFDGRPQAPWHPLPLSELLILAGAIAFVLALVRLNHHGLSSGGPLLLAGILALGIGTGEVSWREHSSGFRSHTILLAFIPVLCLHTLVVVGYSTLASPSRVVNIAMLALDAIVFVLLARLLRRRFLAAHARRQ